MKITVEGNVFEGTPGEIKEMMTLMGAEFPEGETKESTEETPTFKEGGQVKALADGEFGDIKAGEIGEVTSIDAGYNARDRYNIEVTIEDGEFDYFRPQDLEITAEEEKPYEPSEGDIVVITANTNRSVNKVGDIGKVVELGRIHRDRARVEVAGKVYSDILPSNWTLFYEMRPATDEEKSQYEMAVKLAKIGRKPGEFKKGDIVRVSWMDGKGFVNELAEIHSGPIGDGAGGNYYLNDGKDATLGDDIELIAPAESRVDQ